MNGSSPLSARLGNLADASIPLAPEVAPRQPGSVLVYDKASGEQRYLPAEEATAAFKAGQVNLVSGAPVGIVGEDGQARTETDPATIVGELQKGAELVGPDVAHKADLRREYSGLGGAGIALASGLDTATAGIGTQTAELLGGAYGEDVREAVEASNEDHGIVHGAGALGGAVLQGALLPGAAIEEGASGLLHGLTGLEKGIGSLGARATARAVPLAVRASAELPLLEEGQALSEDALNDGDHRLTGEQLFARMGHAALTGFAMGAVTGGALEVGGTAFRAAREGAQPVMTKIANREMWRDLNSAQTVSRKVLNRVEGGEEAIGQTARDIGIDDPTLTPKEQLEIASTKQDETGAAIGDMYRRSGATGTARPLVEKIDALIADVNKVAGAEGVAKGLETYRASLLDKLAAGVEESGAATAKMQPEELAWFNEEQRLRSQKVEAGLEDVVRAQADKLKAAREAKFGAAAKATDPLDHPVGLEELWNQRRGLDKLLKWEGAKDPQQRIQLLRDFRRHFNEYLLETGEKSAAARGESFAEPLRALNKRYSHLGYINEALETKVVRNLANRRASLTDTIMGGAGLQAGATALLAGHPMVAMTALASGLANKAFRQLGPRIAAWTLGRTATIEDLAAHSSNVDAAIARMAGSIYEQREGSAVKPPPAPASPMAERHAKAGRLQGDYDELAATVREAAAHPALGAGYDSALQHVAQHAPKAAQAARQTAMAAVKYLADTLPPEVKLDPLRPSEVAPPPAAAMAKWLRGYDAVEDPSILFRQISARAIDPVALEAVSTVYPSVMGKARTELKRAMLERPQELSRSARLALSPVVGTPLTYAAMPERAASRQAYYAEQTRSPGGPGTGPKRGSRSPDVHGAPTATESERIEGKRA